MLLHLLYMDSKMFIQTSEFIQKNDYFYVSKCGLIVEYYVSFIMLV